MLRLARLLAAPVLKKFKPNCCEYERSTSANRTLMRIWASTAGTLTRRRFTGLPNVLAIMTARSALVRSFTVPLRNGIPSSSVIEAP